MCRFSCAFASLMLLLLAGAPASAREELPRFNVEAVCRAAPSLVPGDQSPYQSCMKDEADARTQLERQWNSFNDSSRRTCVEETNVGGSPSYVDVLTCLQMNSGDFTPPPPLPAAPDQ
jgi:hypothetical protein